MQFLHPLSGRSQFGQKVSIKILYSVLQEIAMFMIILSEVDYIVLLLEILLIIQTKTQFHSVIFAWMTLKLSGTAEAILFKNLYEVLINPVDHSGARNGVYTCGHWFPNKKELAFSVYDTGIGIPAHIKSHINNDFTSKEAVEWALVKGNSTKQLDDGTPRGLGLSDLKDFIELNKGTFIIASNDIYYSYNQGVSCKYLIKPIIGTMVSFIIRNDEEHIYFAQ